MLLFLTHATIAKSIFSGLTNHEPCELVVERISLILVMTQATCNMILVALQIFHACMHACNNCHSLNNCMM